MGSNFRISLHISYNLLFRIKVYCLYINLVSSLLIELKSSSLSFCLFLEIGANNPIPFLLSIARFLLRSSFRHESWDSDTHSCNEKNE